MTNQLKPDAIMITGDLFDGMDGDLSEFPPILNKLEVPKGIYFISGNHESYLGMKLAYEVISKTKITNLDDQFRQIDGLQIIGKAYAAEQEYSSPDFKKFMASFKNYQSNMPTLLLYHVPYPSAVYQARDAGVNLMLSGHTHKGQMFPFNFITNMVYKGFDRGLHTDGDFNLYTSVGVGTWGPPMRSGNHPEIVNITLK